MLHDLEHMQYIDADNLHSKEIRKRLTVTDLKVLTVSDADHLRQTFILQSLNSVSSSGIIVSSVISKRIRDRVPYDVIYSGFGEKFQINYTHYFWYFFLKSMLATSKKYKDFVNSIADWSINGRLMGTARALRWLRILRKVRKWRPSLIHVHFAWNLPPFIPVARFLDIPIVCTVHGSDIYLHDDWHQHLRDPVVKRVVCVSDSMKNSIETNCADLRNKTVRVFNPVNEFFLEDVQEPRDKLRIVMVAAFRLLKNHAWLLESLRTLKDRGIDFNCVLVGDVVPWESEVFDETRSMAKRLGLSDRVVFRGWLSAEAVVNEIDHSTVLALTSLSEGFGMVVVEALARQRIPVVTDLPGTRDATGDGQYGFLVPLNDTEALANALSEAHKETVSQGAMVRSGRDFVERNFRPEVHAAQLQEIYDAAIQENDHGCEKGCVSLTWPGA